MTYSIHHQHGAALFHTFADDSFMISPALSEGTISHFDCLVSDSVLLRLGAGVSAPARYKKENHGRFCPPVSAAHGSHAATGSVDSSHGLKPVKVRLTRQTEV